MYSKTKQIDTFIWYDLFMCQLIYFTKLCSHSSINLSKGKKCKQFDMFWMMFNLNVKETLITMFACMYVYMYWFMYVYMFMYAFVCLYVFIFVFLYVCNHLFAGVADKKSIGKMLSCTFFLYFACILPSIAFGVLNSSNTEGVLCEYAKTLLVR